MLEMRGLISKTFEVGRGSKVHVEGLILCMIPITSFIVATENCERQPAGFDIGRSRVGG